MQEFEYRLEKEDYKNWIHWNVLKHESKKMKMVSAPQRTFRWKRESISFTQ